MSDCLFTYYDAEAVGGLCFELFLILLVVLFFQWADRGKNAMGHDIKTCH